ncbi:MAG: hypothetical protein ACE5Q6_16705, partial [Dehalococcoidia bacterium]
MMKFCTSGMLLVLLVIALGACSNESTESPVSRFGSTPLPTATPTPTPLAPAPTLEGVSTPTPVPLPSPVASPAEEYSATSRVTGRVLLQAQGENDLNGTTIMLYGDEVIPIRTSTTLPDGSYFFDLSSGSYTLDVVRQGWQQQKMEFRISESEVDLGTIELPRARHATCQDVILGQSGAPSIDGVTASLHPRNRQVLDFSVRVDQPARVWVEYYPAEGKGSGFKTPVSPEAATSHDFQVMRLLPDTTYCYQVFAESIDNNGRTRVSDA